MTTFDYLLLALAAGVLLYQLNLLRRRKRDVIIPGIPPNRKTVAILMAAVIFLAILRADEFALQWPLFVLIMLVCLTVFLAGAGLSPTGMYSSGTFISFQQAAYYDIDQRADGRTVFRLSRLTKEGHMLIKPEQVEEIEALMEQNRIPTFTEYRSKMAKRMDTRMEATQKRKKKRK